MRGLLAILLLSALPAFAGAPPTVDQVARWRTGSLRPSALLSLDKAVALYQRTSPRYEAVAHVRSDGVPAPVIFALHYRESSNSFSSHLHEGSPLTHRTRYVPKGRIPGLDPPYTWEQSARDAIYVADRLQGDWHSLSTALNRIEGYNGTGYRRLGLPTPYLWSGTTVYTRGKYVADGRFSATAVDGQLGCAAILKRMQERGISLPFAP